RSGIHHRPRLERKWWHALGVERKMTGGKTSNGFGMRSDLCSYANGPPIGVSEEPACADEYYSNLGPAVSILVNGATDEAVRGHLSAWRENGCLLRRMKAQSNVQSRPSSDINCRARNGWAKLTLGEGLSRIGRLPFKAKSTVRGQVLALAVD